MKKILIILIFVLSFLITRKEIINIVDSNALLEVVIDPGHGGYDQGAVALDKTKEAEINLKIALFVKEYLENSGFKVTLTRSGDYDLATDSDKVRKTADIKRRVDIINNSSCCLFVSIHANIYSSSSIKGAQVFYKDNEDSKKLANDIQEAIKEITKNTSRKSLVLKDKYILENATKPGCIVEVGFLSNEEELLLLKSTSYQEKMALAIASGIIDYLSLKV